VHTPLRPDQLTHPIAGYGTSAATLEGVLGDDTTVLVFLRHYG
jgi:hypothetical protein